MNCTLIISAYNRAPLLRRILSSILNQSVPVDKVIVADDGSLEDLGGVCRDVHEISGISITHVTQDDNGFRLARSRNNAIRLADDGILIFADQDMLFTKGYISILKSRLRKERFLAGYLLRLDQDQTDMITVRNNMKKIGQ